jgi:hypothetical protein
VPSPFCAGLGFFTAAFIASNSQDKIYGYLSRRNGDNGQPEYRVSLSFPSASYAPQHGIAVLLTKQRHPSSAHPLPNRTLLLPTRMANLWMDRPLPNRLDRARDRSVPGRGRTHAQLQFYSDVHRRLLFSLQRCWVSLVQSLSSLITTW